MDIVYIKLEPKIQIPEEKVSVSDVAEIVCRNEAKKDQVKALCIHTFGIADRDVVTSLYIVNEIEKNIKDIVVVPLGAEDVILERVPKKKPSRVLEIGKVVFVSMVCFFGTGFTIMAFHNDIGIRGVFEEISSLITGTGDSGVMVLELSYAFGLMAGILIFFNHIGKRRLTKDPTPIEVSMRNYEDDVNKTLSETWDREGKTIEAP
ncbi:MAG: stage V sporulation protein AA [Lachnospiraceae bacterium]|nr:stage V sporulation protein AA [Lachnospiraceae bacterium]